ncbi:MAG: HD-GYP domain-containing protein [Bdellovibrio sp.]
MKTTRPQILVLGDPNCFRARLVDISAVSDVTYLNYGSFELGEEFKLIPSLIICAAPPAEISMTELAQSIRMNYLEEPVYIVLEEREKFHRTNLLKNGFTDAFLFPIDRSLFEKAVKHDIAAASQGALKVYRNIQLVDIEPGTKLGFDLYLHLPANNKHLKIVAAQDSMNAEKVEKLLKNQINSAAVAESQIGDFYKYSAERLKALGKKDTVSETEKQEQREKAVRTLLSGIFGQSLDVETIDGGRGLMKDCNEIVKAYIGDGNDNSWYERFLKISISAGSSYSHAENTAGLACMLAIGMGLKDIEDIGLAGLLHDIGVSDLPPEVSGKSEAERSLEEQAIYQKHPEKSIDLIKSKKMIVSEKVIKIILQHHERFDGKGYPNGLSGARICAEAQILQIADKIAKIIEVTPGRSKIGTREAALKILEDNDPVSGRAMVSHEIATKIKSLLL